MFLLNEEKSDLKSIIFSFINSSFHPKNHPIDIKRLEDISVEAFFFIINKKIFLILFSIQQSRVVLDYAIKKLSDKYKRLVQDIALLHQACTAKDLNQHFGKCRFFGTFGKFDFFGTFGKFGFFGTLKNYLLQSQS